MFGTVSFLPKSATPAFVSVPFRVTLVLPEVLVPGLAQLAVPFCTRVTLVNSTIVGLAPEGTPLNAATQPGKFDAGAVDAVPVPTSAFFEAPAFGPQAAYACFNVVVLEKVPAHFGTPVVLNLKSLSKSRVTVFANPPWALTPGWV